MGVTVVSLGLDMRLTVWANSSFHLPTGIMIDVVFCESGKENCCVCGKKLF